MAVMPTGSAMEMPTTCTFGSSPLATEWATVAATWVATAGCALSCSMSATCRAVGWSKTSVLDSETPVPTRRRNWLRISTAPSESTPASISGASASVLSSPMRRTISNTSCSVTTGRALAGADSAPRVGLTCASSMSATCRAVG
eukprot:474632-Prymnesium_polylepis.3